MALPDYDAGQFAQKLLIALAENGAIEMKGTKSATSTDAAVNRGTADAAYLSSLYRSLVAGLQE